MTIDEIAGLVRRLERAGVTEFQASDAGASLAIRLAPGGVDTPSAPAAVAVPASPPQPEAVVVRGIGLLRLGHPSARDAPEPAYPRDVGTGEVLAYLEAGACLRPVAAERACRIGPPLVSAGCLVGYGTRLFPIL